MVASLNFQDDGWDIFSATIPDLVVELVAVISNTVHNFCGNFFPSYTCLFTFFSVIFSRWSFPIFQVSYVLVMFERFSCDQLHNGERSFV